MGFTLQVLTPVCGHRMSNSLLCYSVLIVEILFWKYINSTQFYQFSFRTATQNNYISSVVV